MLDAAAARERLLRDFRHVADTRREQFEEFPGDVFNKFQLDLVGKLVETTPEIDPGTLDTYRSLFDESTHAERQLHLAFAVGDRNFRPSTATDFVRGFVKDRTESPLIMVDHPQINPPSIQPATGA
jgi:hypothetical protein